MMIELNEDEIAQMIVDRLTEDGVLKVRPETPVQVKLEKRDGGKVWAQVWPMPEKKDKPSD